MERKTQSSERMTESHVCWIRRAVYGLPSRLTKLFIASKG